MGSKRGKEGAEEDRRSPRRVQTTSRASHTSPAPLSPPTTSAHLLAGTNQHGTVYVKDNPGGISSDALVLPQQLLTPEGQVLPATSTLATFKRAVEADVDYSAFLEDGLFDFGRAGDDELSSGGGIGGSSRSSPAFASTSAAPPTYRAPQASHVAPTHSAGSFVAAPGDYPSTSTSPPFPTLDPFRSLSMQPPPSRAASEALSPYSWDGAGNGGFPADGGARPGGVQQQVPGYYTVPPLDDLALSNPYFSSPSESHPDRTRIPDWTSPSNTPSQSYSGPSSFSSVYPNPYGAPIGGLTASSLTASSSFQQPLSPSLSQQSSSQTKDHSLLALHRSLDVQAQGRSAHSSPYGSLDDAGSKMREGALKRSNSSGTKSRGTRGPAGGAPGSAASSAASRSRYKTHPTPQVGPHGPYQSHSALTSPSVSPPVHYSNHPLAPGTYQRALPSLPRRTSSGVTTSSAASSTTSTPQPSYSMPPAFSSPSLSRASSVVSPTPPISRPASPRIAGVDYGFTALEKDLDLYASRGFAAASAQSPHALAGYGTRGYESPVGGQLRDNTPSPNVIANVLGESLFGSQSGRSPTDAGGGSSESNGTSRHATAAGESATTSNKVSPSSGDVASPTGSTLIDEETGEALSKKDPISAQVWRMFNKAKTTLPNGARMENLTWRLMSMTLKKRREETAALEAEAAAAGIVGQSVPSPGTAAEEADEVGQLRGRSAGKGKGRETESVAANMDREDEGRGRKGRTPTSIEASPEVEEDFMDWRAKSQSRSRSRAPDVAMDWRAASRSRSRAPDFRVARPPSLSGVEVSSATAQLSRFHNDSGGRVTATEEDDKNRISFAESLGLSPGPDFFASPGVNGTPLDYGSSPPMFGFPPDSQSPEAPTTDPNLTAIEDTLNQLITLQSLAASSAPPSSVSSPWMTPSTTAPPSSERVAIASPAFSNLYADPATSGSHPGYAFSPRLSSIVENGASVTAEQQFQQIVNGRHQQLGGISSLPNGASAPRQAPPSAYANAINLAQLSRPFSFSPATASGLSLARPSHVLPETSQPLSPDLNHVPAPSYMYASSAPVHHHNFPHPPAPYGAGGESPALYDYFQAHRDAMAAQQPYGSPYGHPGIPHHLHAPMHVNPSQLLNNLQGPMYDSDNSSWVLSPHSGNDSSSRNGTPSPPGPPKPFHTSMSSSFDPNYRIPSTLGMRSSSTPDLVALVKSKAKGAAAARTQLGVSSKLATGSNPALNESDVTEDGSTKCLNCSTTNTPLWRRDADGRPLCNACGLFRNLHGVDRPATLNTGIIKKRNRARGPKELQPKKSGAGRATGRRNSLTAAPARAVPYPPTSVRTAQP